MHRLTVLLAALAAALYPQTASEVFEKAPPDVDQALRSRIAFFYQSHVEGKFRQAEQAVAEDSKESFYNAEKTRYKSFEIVKIAYSDAFTRARAVVTLETELFMFGLGKRPVKMPLTSLWKVENGQWVWYVDPDAGKETPFGRMKPGEGGEGTVSPFSVPSRRDQVGQFLNHVKVDRSEVQLSSYQPASDTITVSNGLQGKITLDLEYNGFPGFEAKLERAELEPKQTTRVLLSCKPEDKSPKPTTVVTLRVRPTNQVIPIRVTFAVPR